MAIDIGDPVVLTFTVTDTAGAPANASSATITVTLPDDSTSAPTVTNPVTGTYTATYITTQAGHHRVRCVASGTNASTQTDVFDVAASDPGYIIGLAEARRAIGQAAAGVKDEDLRTYLEAMTLIIEDLAGPQLKATGRTWTADGGTQSILLPSAVSAVTSVTESGSTLTPNVDYTVNLRAGIVHRGNVPTSYVFLPGNQNIVITYTVGATAIPANVRLAARRLLRHLWQSEQQGYRPDMGSPDGAVAYTPAGYAVPRAVVELLRPNQNQPGIA